MSRVALRTRRRMDEHEAYPTGRWSWGRGRCWRTL